MKARRGQVAVYLVLVLVALTFLMLMNVGAYLAVTAKNRAMNAGDSAALAAAACQGRLLERIGELNLEHLKLLGEGAGVTDAGARRMVEIANEQGRLVFLGPLEGIRLANEAAARVGAKACGGMSAILSEHVNEVRTVYAQAPELYPEPWRDAWEEYATALEQAIGGGVVAGPDNVDFRNAMGGHLLKNGGFYAAVDGRAWCWFRNNPSAMSVLENYSSYRDWAPIPEPEAEAAFAQCANSEVFPLYLEVRTGSANELLGPELIARLTGWTEEAMKHMPGLDDRSQVWYFFDELRWGRWKEIDPDGGFPAVGKVRPEYDVRGCAAICRVYENIPVLVAKSGEREVVWSAAAKPFATFVDAQGAVAPITACKFFVVPAEWDVRLVPVDTVGGKDLSTADYNWVKHVKEHLPVYLESGPDASATCGYCRTLVDWEREALRREGCEWLRSKADSCVRPGGPGGVELKGGTPHGH